MDFVQPPAPAQLREARSPVAKVVARLLDDQEREREKRRVRQARFRHRHRWRLQAEARAGYYRRTYGLTMEERERMLEQQGGRCAICREPMVSPQVDHDHRTGKIRGLLCQGCNVGLGAFRDRVPRLRRAIGYLQKSRGRPA